MRAHRVCVFAAELLFFNCSRSEGSTSSVRTAIRVVVVAVSELDKVNNWALPADRYSIRASSRTRHRVSYKVSSVPYAPAHVLLNSGGVRDWWLGIRRGSPYILAYVYATYKNWSLRRQVNTCYIGTKLIHLDLLQDRTVCLHRHLYLEGTLTRPYMWRLITRQEIRFLLVSRAPRLTHLTLSLGRYLRTRVR